jgi:hypothetical protein
MRRPPGVGPFACPQHCASPIPSAEFAFHTGQGECTSEWRYRGQRCLQIV